MNVGCVDPGFANLGLGVIDSSRMHVLEARTLHTEKASKKANVTSSSDMILRARSLVHEVRRTFEKHEVRCVFAEAMSYPRSSIAAAQLGYSWGIIVTVSVYMGIPILDATPKVLKKELTGNAAASKKDVQSAVEKLLTGTPEEALKKDAEHLFDALAAGIWGIRRANLFGLIAQGDVGPGVLLG